jgi:hypothetical protein
MRGLVIKLLVVILCLGLALPALVAADEPVTSKYNVKIWGRVKMDYSYDTAQFVNYNDFLGVPADSQATANQTNDSTDFNGRDTRLGFSASHDVDGWAGKGVVELDFYGTNSGDNLIPRLRLGYADLANKDWGTSVRAGQDWNPVMQLNPSTIDFGILSATGNLWWRRPQLTVRQQVEGGLEFLVSAMLARRQSTASESRMPWLLGRVAYSFDLAGGKHMAALNGGYQHDKTSATADSIDRTLLGAELKFDFDPVLVKGEFWWGEGIGGDFLRYGLDTYTNGAGDVRTWEAWGFWADVTYKIIPKWSVTAGFGMDNPDDNGYRRATIGGGDINRTFTEAYNAFVNTWYTLGPDVKVGFEAMFLTAEREKLNGNSFKDKGERYTLSLYYGF